MRSQQDVGAGERNCGTQEDNGIHGLPWLPGQARHEEETFVHLLMSDKVIIMSIFYTLKSAKPKREHYKQDMM